MNLSFKIKASFAKQSLWMRIKIAYVVLRGGTVEYPKVMCEVDSIVPIRRYDTLIDYTVIS